jgi:hypothetical protein
MNDEIKLGFMALDLKSIKAEAEEVSGNWNGKTEVGEEEAQCANDIIEKVDELLELLEELNDY